MMKKFTLVSVFLISITCCLMVNAQYCGNSGSSICSTANSPLQAEGFYPTDANLPCVVVGQYYDTVIQIRTPSTVSSGGSSYDLSYIVITSITNLPCGLCWATGNSSNQIDGNADGCLRVSGTSFDAPGQYLMDIVVNATVSVGGIPITEDGQNLSSQGLNFFARVMLPGGTCEPIDTTSNGNTASTPGNIAIPSITGPSTVCSGSATLTANSGYYGYVWSNGELGSSINVTTSGTYTVTVYDNCTSATASKTLTVASAPVVTITPPTSICTGSSATLTATGGGTYVWNNAGTTGSITVHPTSNTNYSVTVTNSNNCSASATTSVAVNASPSVTISPTTDTVCSGTPTTLTASGTGTYNWSSGQTVAGITVSPTATTVYSVTLSSGANCTATASRAVVVNSSTPTIIANGPTTFCTGGSVSLEVDSSFTTYLWSTGATTSSVTINEAGTFDATVTKNGCTGVSNSIAVTVGSNLSPTITANPGLNICPGGHTTLDAGSGYTSYIWSGSAGTHETADISTAGVYSVTVSSGTCSGSASATVNVGNYPVSVSITPTSPISSCSGDTVTLNAGSGFASYAWSTGSQIATSQVTTTGSYSVTVTKNACIGTDTVQVNFSQVSPVITPTGPVTECSGLSDTTTLFATGVTGLGVVYAWSDGENTQSIQPTTSGNYKVTVTNNGCSGVAGPVSVTVNQSPSPVIAPAGTASVCSGGSLRLEAGSGYAAYSWSNGATTQTIFVNAAGSYTVTVTNNGCTGVAEATTVNVVQRPVASIGTPVSVNGTSYLTASPAGAAYQWLVQSSPNGSYAVTSTATQNDTVTCTGSAEYYSVIATQGGCADTSSQVEVVCTGINEIPSLLRFSIHPNPAIDVLYVNYELNDNINIKLSVIDLTGRKVIDVMNGLEAKGVHQRQVNLTDLSSGIYLLNFVTENGSFNSKFVKQ